MGRPKVYDGGTVSVTVRLEVGLVATLDAAALRSGVSRSRVLNAVLEDWRRDKAPVPDCAIDIN